MYLFYVPILESTVVELCNNTNLNCVHGCRLKHGVTRTTGHTTADVECFCKDGFDADKNDCTGNILSCLIK